MKKIFSMFIMLVPFVALSGNWELFPKNQKLYYVSGTAFYYNNWVDFFLMDSIKTVGQDTVHFFRKNLNLQGAGNCYSDALSLFYPADNNPYYFDSLIQRGDTVFYYDNSSSFPFFFLPEATVGKSWTITSDYYLNDYDQITITCSSIQSETFIGITDSVKTFTMHSNGTSTNQMPIDSFVIKLSKQYGLIIFVPFEQFLYHPSYNGFSSLKLIGIESSGIKSGYTMPKFEDYFHLSAGDILLWNRTVDPWNITEPGLSEYYRDSITQTTITADSVIFYFNRIKKTDTIITQQNGLFTKFLKNEFINIIETPPNWIGFGNNQFSQSWLSPFQENDVPIWTSSYLTIDIDSITGDTITSYSFYNAANYVDTTSCILNQVFDVGFNFSINTYLGVTQYCFNNWGSDCTYLLGSQINGQIYGNINFPNQVTEEATINHSIEIFPNPNYGQFSVQASGFRYQVPSFNIYNILGETIYSTTLHKQQETFDLPFPAGIYFLKISDGEKIYSKKLVIEKTGYE